MSTGSAWLCGVGVALQGHPGHKSDSTTLLLTINVLAQSSNCSKTREIHAVILPSSSSKWTRRVPEADQSLEFFQRIKSLFFNTIFL